MKETTPVFFDIETDGLTPTKVHCIVAANNDHAPKQISTLHDLQSQACEDPSMVFVGHNIIGYDFPVLEKFDLATYLPLHKVGACQVCWKNSYQCLKVFDTLVASRVLFPNIADNDFQKLSDNPDYIPKNLIGSHSLRAWGYRLGLHKGDHDEWEEFTEEMLDYCKQDVEVTRELYKVCVRKMDKTGFTWENLNREQECAAALQEQMDNGIPFNESKAISLYSELSAKKEQLEHELQNVFPPKTERMKTVEYWIDPETGTQYRLKTQAPSPLRPHLEPGPNKVKIHPFNPASRDQIADRLKEKYGWKPQRFSGTGKPVVDESVLVDLKYPEAQMLVEYLTLQKRLGAIGDGSSAWLKLCKNSKLYPYINHNGAVSGRCTHSSPNLAQVTAPRSPWGKEMRACFEAPEGYKFVGADLDQIELRMLAHFLQPYDQGEYIKAVLEGDIHSYNRDKAVEYLPWLGDRPDSRDVAKTLIYATVYGGGPAVIGAAAGAGIKEGKQLQNAFFSGIPALPKLIDLAKSQFRDRGYLRGIDGRPLYPRSEHSSLNILLQSSATVVFKRATVLIHHALCRQGLTSYAKQVAHIHDEVQFVVREDLAEQVGQLICDAYEEAGKDLGIRIPTTGSYKVGNDWSETH